MTIVRHALLAIVLLCTCVVGAAAFETGRIWFGGVAAADVVLPSPADVTGSGSAVAASAPPMLVPVALPVPAFPDPNEHPVEDLSQAQKLYKSGAFVDAGILLAFIVLSIASLRIPALRKDHRAIYISAVLGGLALLVVPASAGATPSLTMIVTACTTTIGLILNPRMPAAIGTGLPTAQVVSGGNPPSAPTPPPSSLSAAS